MRFTVVTFGSDGDTRPYAALCRGLIDAGHEAVLFSECSSIRIATELGVPAKTLDGDLRSIMPRGSFSQNVTLREMFATGKNISKLVTDNSESWLKQISTHARDSDAILFSGFALFSALAAGIELNKPAIGLWLMPITPTNEFCSPMMPPLRLPGWLNRLSFHAMRASMWRAYGGGINAARLKLFGGRPREKIGIDFPILYGLSPHLVATPKDWPGSDRICGHWHLPTSDWQPPTDLKEFLAAGPPPIYVGFGSPSCFIRKRRLDTIVSAIAGRRALFYPGWSDIDASMLPKNILLVRETPHDWLFPQCSMAIHHGGAGTTHTSARAGIPSVVLPFGGDQFFWANRLTTAGVAPKYASPRALTARLLGEAIEFAQQDVVRENAQRLGAALKKEDGIGTAIAHIVEMQKRATQRSSLSTLGRLAVE